MTRRQRKIVGACLMLAEVSIYPFVAMALADSRPVQQAPGPLQALIYALLGLAWIVPLMPLIKWMEKPQRAGA